MTRSLHSHFGKHLQDSYEKALGSASDIRPSRSTASSEFVSPLHRDVSSAAAGGKMQQPGIIDPEEVESARRDPAHTSQGDAQRSVYWLSEHCCSKLRMALGRSAFFCPIFASCRDQDGRSLLF